MSSSSTATALDGQTFWCHECDMSVTLLSPPPPPPSLLCPHCNSDFLEQMDIPDMGAIENQIFDSPHFEELINHLAEDSDMSFLHAPPPNSRAASKSAIDSLPTIKILDLDPSLVCAICKDPIEVNTEAKQLPCKHLYHKDCILPWLTGHNSCPLCRFCLPTEAEELRQGSRRVSDVADAVAGMRFRDGDFFGLGETLRIIARRHGVDFPAAEGGGRVAEQENDYVGLGGVVGTESEVEIVDTLLEREDSVVDEAVDALLSDIMV